MEACIRKRDSLEKDYVGKYGDEEEGWCSKESRKSFRVRLWKAIRSG